MIMDFRVKGKLQIKMHDYMKKLMNSLPEDMIWIKHTATPKNSFQTDEEAIKLSKSMNELSHKITAQVL